MRVPVDLITATTDACVSVLRPYADRDWRTTRAWDLQWSCWDTALHIAGDLYFYAVQLLYGPLQRVYLRPHAARRPAAPGRVVVGRDRPGVMPAPSAVPTNGEVRCPGRK